MFNAIDSLK